MSEAMNLLFKVMDLNGDGFISPDEIKECMGFVGAPSQIADAAVAELLKRDDDKDGKLNEKEFTSAEWKLAGRYDAAWMVKAFTAGKEKKEKEAKINAIPKEDLVAHMAGEKVMKAFEGDVELKTVLKDAEYVGFYMSAHWCGPCRNFTPKLVEAYKAWDKKSPGKFPIIFVSADKTNEAFQGYFAEMPWYAVKYEDKERIGFEGAAAIKTECNGIPKFAIFTKSGDYVSGDGVSMVSQGGDIFESLKMAAKLATLSGDELFPTLLGEQLLSEGGKGAESKVSEVVNKAKVVGMYFSAHWCGPCRRFTPMLVEAYKKINEANPGQLAIVFISADRDEGSFNKYYETMPWHAVKFSDSKRKGFQGYAASKYECQGIPYLVLFDGKGNLLTKEGTGKVYEDKNDFVEKLIAKHKL